MELVAFAQAVARQTNEGVLVTDWLRTTEQRIRRAKAIADGVAAAQGTLAKTPDNPDANGLVGGFLVFKWTIGQTACRISRKERIRC